jgi:2-polyprenyl-6-methoxyphenol hydroxylase-like FAD-dependent oxidoreductase
LKVIEGWDQRPRDIIAMTPEAQLIDYKLLWRDPLPKWVSKHGRMMLVGDSAHPFLPTSGQGAGQAIEDAATVAICLELAGKEKVPLGLRTSEKLR